MNKEWKIVIVPKVMISPNGNMTMTGVVGHYEIIAMPESKFYPLSDIVLHLN